MKFKTDFDMVYARSLNDNFSRGTGDPRARARARTGHTGHAASRMPWRARAMSEDREPPTDSLAFHILLQQLVTL